jgi:predicted short-subunit dehydrogenase-like oxidoreductase (DUF2520 family)
MIPARVAIVGAGRMGQGLGLALAAAGSGVTLLARSPRQAVLPIAAPRERWADPLREAAVVIIATPDAAIAAVAAELADLGVIRRAHVVLHLSGLLDRSALAALSSTGAALGSWHPLQTVADATTGPERLRGAYAGIEGDERAASTATILADAIGMKPVLIPAGGKGDYHIGATFVANYAAALLALGQMFAERAGVPSATASELYRPLLAGAAGNLVQLGPVAALTGAVRRGDVGTIAAHLDRLTGRERRLYCDLGMVALGLAIEAGLPADAAARVEGLLTG